MGTDGTELFIVITVIAVALIFERVPGFAPKPRALPVAVLAKPCRES